MCGIAGILNFDSRPVPREEMELLTDAIAHRGRDSAAVRIGGNGADSFSAYPGIALGHRRLSVIDLSPAAAQPMASADRRQWLVYNGELYNYRELRQELTGLGSRFATESDSEVLLAAYRTWGKDCLARFNGMFAFAVWDEDRQSLFCARDAIGIKPFYYRWDGQGFRFSSESRSLAGKDLDPQALASYFLSMYVPRELSIHVGVRKLLPGCWLEVFRDGRCVEGQWWRLPAMATDTAGTEEAAVRLQSALDRAVTLQLRSDVPVGMFLSGGFDSGMVLASAAQQSACLHTYSVGFGDPRQFDELPIAAAQAERYGSRHHAFTLDSRDAIETLDRALSVMTEPVADSAVVPTWYLARQAAADGVKVLLSGTGGDEVFGGYSRYVASSWRRGLLHHLPEPLRWAAGRVVRDGMLGARLRQPSLDMVAYTGGSADLAAMLLATPDRMIEFLDRLATRVYPPVPAGVPLLYRNMTFDLQVYLPDLLLLLLDQLCMAHTVEGRVPLLDTDLIRSSFSLPPELHANPRQAATRRLMRRMARGRLDPRTFTAPKQGFSGPVRAWIADYEENFRNRTMELASIPGLEHMQPERWWKRPPRERDARWAHEVFLMYAFSTWYEANVRG